MRLAGATLVVLGSACAVVAPRSSGSERFGAGSVRVAHRDYTFVNRSRPVDPSASDGGPASPRTLTTRVWFPLDDPGPHALVVYSHGYSSNRRGGAYLAEWLAGRGYVVAAPDHPLTHRWAPHGPRVDDVVNQPGDVHVVIDGVLAWGALERPFPGTIDPQQIGVVGLSLGGMTATLAAFHPRLRDPRIAAVVSLAGPMTIFGASFFATAPAAFLMVAGDADVIVDYATNAPLVLERVPDGALVTIAGASHAGFDDTARFMRRLMGNPDRIACWWLASNLDLSRSREVLTALGGRESGMVVPEPTPRPCLQEPPAGVMDPVRQQLITKLVVATFFDSRFSRDPGVRRAAEEYLQRGLAVDFPEAAYGRSLSPHPWPEGAQSGPEVPVRQSAPGVSRTPDLQVRSPSPRKRALPLMPP
jgi:poly(3-hydroxybutyrate) depolymerase